MANGNDSLGEIEYIYHYHVDGNGTIIEGESSQKEGGCFTVANNHIHNSSCYSSCGGAFAKISPSSSCTDCGKIIGSYTERYTCAGHGCWFEAPNSLYPSGCMHCNCSFTWKCNKCGFSTTSYYVYSKACTQAKLVCNKTIDNYSPSCGYHNGTITGAIITY